MFIDLTDTSTRCVTSCALLRRPAVAAEREAMLTERFGLVYRDVVRRMGRDGWLAWAGAEYGGAGSASRAADLRQRGRRPTSRAGRHAPT